MSALAENSLSLAAQRTRAEIDLSALRHNARVCREACGGTQDVMAVIKADAYGHGKVPVAIGIANEVDWFGVASISEAQAIREAGVSTPILILGPILPQERELAVKSGFGIPISSLEEVEAFALLGTEDSPVPIHAVADTGMGRMGALESDFPAVVKAIQKADTLTLEGVASHFPVADEDRDYTEEQIERFDSLVESLKLDSQVTIHLGNSAGILGFSEDLASSTLVRAGLALYGISPLGEPSQEKLKPAMSLISHITLIRDLPAGRSINYGRTFVTDQPMRVGTVGIGYGDGYPRSLSGKEADVWIAGHRCPVLGRVTMDQIVVDLTEAPTEIEVGTPVELFGSHISVTEIAEKAETIQWEILTGITSRVARVYSR